MKIINNDFIHNTHCISATTLTYDTHLAIRGPIGSSVWQDIKAHLRKPVHFLRFWSVSTLMFIKNHEANVNDKQCICTYIYMCMSVCRTVCTI